MPAHVQDDAFLEGIVIDEQKVRVVGLGAPAELGLAFRPNDLFTQFEGPSLLQHRMSRVANVCDACASHGAWDAACRIDSDN